MNLQGICAVVTGSTSGIGLGVAKALGRAGCKVVINSFSDDETDARVTREVADETGAETLYVQADMSKPEDCARLIARAAEAFGPVLVLVNNAGVQHVAKIEEFGRANWDRIIAINLSSAFHTIAAAIPGMKAAGRGRIVNVASAHGLTASPYKSAYVAAKHGIVGLTKTVALEVAREGITCNAICPGYVLTPLVEKQIPEQMKEHGMSRDEVIETVMLARQPSKEFATVEEIGATAVFLCSAGANQITGTTISVDGGWTAL